MDLVERLRNIQNGALYPASEFSLTFHVASELWNQLVDHSLEAADELTRLREQLEQIRDILDLCHTAAYDLRDDVLAILDQEDKP